MGECGLQYMGQCVSRGRVQWAPPLPRVALAQCAVTWDGKRERGRVGVLGVFVVKATLRESGRPIALRADNRQQTLIPAAAPAHNPYSPESPAVSRLVAPRTAHLAWPL